jgi:hypothetical protein
VDVKYQAHHGNREKNDHCHQVVFILQSSEDGIIKRPVDEGKNNVRGDQHGEGHGSC